MIDPNLEAGTMSANEGQGGGRVGPLEGIVQVAEDGAVGMGQGLQLPEVESDGLNEKIMKALQHSDEQAKAEVEASLAT